MADVDGGRLVAWLRGQAAPPRKPLAASIYDGMAARIERGDFDTTEEERS